MSDTANLAQFSRLMIESCPVISAITTSFAPVPVAVTLMAVGDPVTVPLPLKSSLSALFCVKSTLIVNAPPPTMSPSSARSVKCVSAKSSAPPSVRLAKLTVPATLTLTLAPLSTLSVPKFASPVTTPEAPDRNRRLSSPPPPSRAALLTAPPAKISVSFPAPSATDPAMAAPAPTVTLAAPPVCLIAALPEAPATAPLSSLIKVVFAAAMVEVRIAASSAPAPPVTAPEAVIATGALLELVTSIPKFFPVTVAVLIATAPPEESVDTRIPAWEAPLVTPLPVTAPMVVTVTVPPPVLVTSIAVSWPVM